MAAFGKSIHALLDTYSNCISLLKAFRHRDAEPNASSGPETALCSQDKQADLRQSLRTDRDLVEKAYSSRVRESGNRFKKGDTRAISSLDRVLNKLKEAVKNLLRISTQKQNLDLDYESLMCLSNASRLEAIKTIDGLSRRLGSPSRSSLASRSSKASSKASKSSSKSSTSSKSSKSLPESLPPSIPSSRHKEPPKSSDTPKVKRASVQQTKTSSAKKALPQPKKDIKDGKSRRSSSSGMKSATSKTPEPAVPLPKTTSPSPEPTPKSPKITPASAKRAPASPRPAKASLKQQKRASTKHSEKASPKSTSASSKAAAPSSKQPSSSPKLPSSPKPPTPPEITFSPSSPIIPDLKEATTTDAHYSMAPMPWLSPSSSLNPRTSLNRISIMSFSSDSTKLGEIPQRKWQPSHRSLYITSNGSPREEEEDEYNIKPVFPLKPYTVEVKEKGRFWGLFARRGSQS